MSATPHDVVIVAMGANTPIGREAWSSAAAARAGISGFGTHPFMVDSCGEPMRAVVAPWIGIDMLGVDRLEMLLLPAIEEAMESFAVQAGWPRRVGLAVALPSARPGVAPGMEADLAQRLARRFGASCEAPRCYPLGHAAALVALKDAKDALAQGQMDACIVAAVDSYIDPSTLDWLESCDQLHGAGRHNNAWGFTPGEAGAALLLMRGPVAAALGIEPLAAVWGVGIASERNLIKTETVCIGDGLTRAFLAAFQPLSADVRVSDVYCDMNGEPYRADEFGFTCLRTSERFVCASDFVAPADCWGDVGAAGAVLHIVLAAVAGRKGYARGNVAMAWASSETGARGAAVLSTTTGR